METAPTFPVQPTPPGDAHSLTAAVTQHRGVRTTLRALAVLFGIAGAITGLFFAGLVAAFSDCSAGATGMCTNLAGLVPLLEWAIVIVAFAAPLAGGIASCVREEWPWLPAGLMTGAVMVALAVLVSSGQTGILS
jgi:hypothetical protein